MDDVVCGLIVEIASVNGSAPEWIHVLPAGSFKLRDGRGPFHAKDLAALITRSLAPTHDLVIDYDHQTDFAAVPKVGGTAPAAGWIKELQAREDGIWARVEWTPRATQAIADREYRYFSPTFASDKKSGDVVALLHGGLTNTPAAELTPVTSSQLSDEDTSMEELLKSLRAALGLGDDADGDAVVKAAAALQTSATAITAATKVLAGQLEITGGDAEDPAKVVTAAAAKLKETGEGLAKVAAAAGANAGADLATILASVEKVAGNPDPAKFVPMAAVTELQGKVNELMGDKVTASVEAAVKAGKVTPGQKEWAIAYATQDPAGFAKYVDGAPTLVQSGGTGTAAIAASARQDGLDDTALQVCSQLGITTEAYAKIQAEEKETA